MSDEIEAIIVVAALDVQPRRQKPVHVNHWCEHELCQQWGAFGYSTRYGQLWVCGDHREDGERLRR